MFPEHIPLTEKYRPRRFEDVVGQQSAIATLKRHVETKNNASVIALGPSGTGKTSLMRIFSNAMSCEGPAPAPCGHCPICKLFAGPRLSEAAFHHCEFSGAEHREHDAAKFAAQLNREHMFYHYGIFIDEVHGLKTSAADALLKAVEHPRPGTFFMFATTEPDSVRPALRTRCIELELHPLSEAESYGLLTRICDAEGIAWDHAALDMLVVAGRGSARDLVKLLDQTSQQGPLTVALLTKALSLGWVAHLLGYIDALLRGDLVSQEDSLGRWHAPASRKAEAIRNFFVYLHNFEILKRIRVIEPAFYQVTEAQRRAVVAGLAKRAANSKLDVEEYILELAERWRLDPNTVRDETSLSIQLRRFNRILNPPTLELGVAGSVLPAPRPAPIKRPKRLRSTKGFIPATGPDVSGADAYLSLAQTEAIYNAASLLPQEYGVLFNSHLHLNHTVLGAEDPPQAAELMSKITHQFGMRVRAWTGRELHWICLNAPRSGSSVTDLIMHVPGVAKADAEEWFKKIMRLWRGAGEGERDEWTLDIDPVRATRERVRVHWRLVRHLWRGVDPSLEHWVSPGQGMRGALIDLLKVPRRGRGQLGETKLRRFSTSATIGPEKRKQAEASGMTLLSPFADCAWGSIDAGWELTEARERQDERARRRRQLKYLERRFPAGGDVLAERHRQLELENLERSWSVDPRLRQRNSNDWQWWETSPI